jgi:preprotein translocase subunit SecF
MRIAGFITQHTKSLLIATVMIFIIAGGLIGTLGIPLGIDFTGGALTEISYDERPAKAELEADIAALDLGVTSLREATTDEGRPGYILRARDLTDAERQEVEAVLTASGGTIERFTSIGPVIGQELARKALWAIGAVVLIIVCYVAVAFRGISKPVGSWTYGGITILALFHDVLVPAALMSVLGVMLGLEADVLFVMALLAVLGYSVNDTIVVFDRVRENLKQNRTEHTRTIKETGVERTETTYTLDRPFAELVGDAVDQTLLRSVNTSLTTILALGGLYIFGGSVTQVFSLMLIAGILAGTYSSLFIAPPLLIALERRRAKTQEEAEAS